jgi:GNAT superfamily N-acetyltransferase
MENLIFKPAESADIDKLAAFMREFYEYDHIAYDEQAAREALEKFLSRALPARVWVIVSDEEAVGYMALTFGCSLEFRGKDAFLDEIYIREDRRGQGIGQRALEFIEEVCRAEGVKALHLEVERENARAQVLYRKSGFKDHDRYLMTKWIS